MQRRRRKSRLTRRLEASFIWAVAADDPLAR
jgi:hypothetical protein